MSLRKKNAINRLTSLPGLRAEAQNWHRASMSEPQEYAPHSIVIILYGRDHRRPRATPRNQFNIARVELEEDLRDGGALRSLPKGRLIESGKHVCAFVFRRAPFYLMGTHETRTTANSGSADARRVSTVQPRCPCPARHNQRVRPRPDGVSPYRKPRDCRLRLVPHCRPVQGYSATVRHLP